MKVTYPGHPFFGQKLEVIRLCKGHDPDLIVRLPDGFCTTIATRFTDYFAPIPLEIENQTSPSLSEGDAEKYDEKDENASSRPLPLLELNGLLQIVHFMEQHSLQNRTSAPNAASKQALQISPLTEAPQFNAPALLEADCDSTNLHQKNMLEIEPLSDDLLPQPDLDPDERKRL